MGQRKRQLKAGWKMMKDIYRKVLSYRAKVRYLDTIIKPEYMCAAETLDMIRKVGLEDIR